MITKSDGELLRGGGRVQGLRDGQNEFQDEERCTCPLGLGGQAPSFTSITNSWVQPLAFSCAYTFSPLPSPRSPLSPLSPLLQGSEPGHKCDGHHEGQSQQGVGQGGEARGPGGEVR